MQLAIVVNIAQIRSRKESIITLAAERYPPAVARPTVPRFGILAVNGNASISARGKIHYIEVAAGLIYRKTAILTHAEEQKSAIR